MPGEQGPIYHDISSSIVMNGFYEYLILEKLKLTTALAHCIDLK